MTYPANSLSMKPKQRTARAIVQTSGLLLGSSAITLRLAACSPIPLVPTQIGQSGGMSGYLEQLTIEGLLDADMYREALARAIAAVEEYPRDTSLQNSLELAREGVARLDSGPAAADQVIGRMTTTEDRVERNRWYRHQYREHRLGTRMNVYIGQSIDDQERVWMRFSPRYESGKWLFVNSFTVVADGIRYDKSGHEFKRDHSTTGVMSPFGPRTTIREWIDLPVDEQERDMIKAIIQSREAVLRFHGQNTVRDYTFTEMDRLIYRDMLTAFDILKGGQN